MKILIFSDSHGDYETMHSITEKEIPDMIIHLGDGMAEAEQLKTKHPDIEMITCLGNKDPEHGDEELIKCMEVCGKRFVMTHGHTLISYTYIDETIGYKLTDENRLTGRNNMLDCIAENNADILLHGHTHEPYVNCVSVAGRYCWIMNPGRVGCVEGAVHKPTYGILKINKTGTLEWQFAEAD